MPRLTQGQELFVMTSESLQLVDEEILRYVISVRCQLIGFNCNYNSLFISRSRSEAGIAQWLEHRTRD